MSVAEPEPVTARPEPALLSSAQRSWPLLARVLVAVVAVLAIGTIVWPMLVHPHAAYGGDDWLNQLWYIWHQTAWMQDHILPTYYVNYPGAVLYPHFAFYAGPLSALAGATSVVVGGDGLAGYIAWWILAVVSAYGGFYWLGRVAGLGRFAAQVPALVFITSAYYVTLIYARGDWPEFVAVSSMPLFVASSLSIVGAHRLTLGSTAALAVSTVLFSGSHAVTLAYGTAFLLVILTALVAAVPEARRMITRPGVLRWTYVVVPAVMVNAWFLVPFGAYQHLTRMSVTNAFSQDMLNVSKPIVRPEALFTLERASAIEPSEQFVVGLPVIAMAWVLITLLVVLVRRAGSPAWRRTLAVLVVLTAAVTALMMDVGLFLALPAKLQVLQFTYRLESFVLMGVSAALIAALVLVGETTWRVTRPWVLLLVPLVAFSLIAASRQVDRRPVDEALRSTFTDFKTYSMGDYADGTLRERLEDLPKATFRWDRLRANHGSITTSAGPGEYVVSNMLTLVPLVQVDGAKIVAAQTTGGIDKPSLRLAVLKIDDDVPPGPVTIRVGPARPWPVVLGKALSLLGLAGLAANFVAIGVGARRRRRSAVA
jgi:hypothetical protein